MFKKFVLSVIFFSIPATAFANASNYDISVSSFVPINSNELQDHFIPFNLPYGVAYSDGYVFVADTFNNLIRKIDPMSQVHTVAGHITYFDLHGFPLGSFYDGQLNEATFNRPFGIAIGNQGIFVSDSGNNSIRIIENDTVTTFFHQEHYGLNFPTGIAINRDGYLFVADTNNHVIRRISPAGQITTIAGTFGYLGYANGYQAVFNSPMGLVLCPLEYYLFVADTGNNTIRFIHLPTGYVATLAGRVILPSEVYYWHIYDDEYYWEDMDDMPLGDFIDGYGYEAMFNLPIGLALYDEYTLLVADSGNHAIRSINLTEGMLVTTIAGTGIAGYHDGEAYQSVLHFPTNLATGTYGVFVTDTWNNMLRIFTKGNVAKSQS